MANTPAVDGQLLQCEQPQWAPLKSVVGLRLTGWFMWMGEIELADRTRIHAYKHVTTRRYLHLDSSGRAFAFREGRYRGIALATAVARAFVGWEQTHPPEGDVVELGVAIRNARSSSGGLERWNEAAEILDFDRFFDR